jgi:hypothetical protein
MAADAIVKPEAHVSVARGDRAPSTTPRGVAASVLVLQRQAGNRATRTVLAQSVPAEALRRARTGGTAAGPTGSRTAAVSIGPYAVPRCRVNRQERSPASSVET